LDLADRRSGRAGSFPPRQGSGGPAVALAEAVGPARSNISPYVFGHKEDRLSATPRCSTTTASASTARPQRGARSRSAPIVDNRNMVVDFATQRIVGVDRPRARSQDDPPHDRSAREPLQSLGEPIFVVDSIRPWSASPGSSTTCAEQGLPVVRVTVGRRLVVGHYTGA